MTKEYVLKNFPKAENIRISTFYDLPTCLFVSDNYDIEIRTIDNGFLVCMGKIWSRDGISEEFEKIEDCIIFINNVFLNGI